MKHQSTSTEVMAYVNQYYLSLNQLAEQTQQSTQFIEMLIAEKIIPDFSYQMKINLDLDCKAFESLSDVQGVIRYYHANTKNIIELLQSQNEKENIIAMKDCVREQFFSDLMSTVEKSSQLIEQFELTFFSNEMHFIPFFKESWGYYLDGTYGVCLKAPSANNIILKKIATLTLESFWALDENQRKIQGEKAFKAAQLYEKQVLPFPAWVTSHSRSRLRVAEILSGVF